MNLSARSIVTSQFMWWVALALVACVYLFTFSGFKPKLRENRLAFGIDLVGGTYITLRVQTEKAVEAELSDKMQVLRKRMTDRALMLPKSAVVENEAIRFTFANDNEAQDALRELSTDDKQITLKADGDKLFVAFKENVAEHIRSEAVAGNIQVLRSRLDTFGVGEISIAAQGERNIVIELPNVQDPAQAERIIGRAAMLEIKPVERSSNSKEELLDEYDGELPEELEIIATKDMGEGYGREYYIVPKFTDLTGRQLKTASMGFGEGNRGAVVNFQFTNDGGEKFYNLTRKSIGRRVAIILDGVAISAPRVDTAIRHSGYISGNFTTQSATELAMLLKSGAFVAPVTFEERRQIGPSLGQESIDQGLLACIVGMTLLFIFGILMYKVAGLFAFLALVYNLLLIMVVMSFFGATLTLPGIAGMVLTVGMAIDASILIYEKIKEELAVGTSPFKAMEIGFSDAMVVILDSNITTFIVGAVLYWFGTGPIQGFAVTMMIGIVSTLVTGLFFLRSLFTFILRDLGIQKISF